MRVGGGGGPKKEKVSLLELISWVLRLGGIDQLILVCVCMIIGLRDLTNCCVVCVYMYIRS